MSDAAKFLGTVPVGTIFNRLGSGEYIFTHPDHPPQWINPATMTIEELPLPAGIASTEVTIGVDQVKR